MRSTYYATVYSLVRDEEMVEVRAKTANGGCDVAYLTKPLQAPRMDHRIRVVIEDEWP